MAATIGTRSAATEIHAATAFACAIFSAADSCALIAGVLSPVDGEPDGTADADAGADKPVREADPADAGGVVPGATAGGVAALDGGGVGAVGEVDDEAETVGCGGGSGMPLGCGPGDTAGMASPMSDASAIRCCRCSSRSGPSNSTRAGASANARSYCATNREVSV